MKLDAEQQEALTRVREAMHAYDLYNTIIPRLQLQLDAARKELEPLAHYLTNHDEDRS